MCIRDRSVTAKKFGLGKKVLNNFTEEKAGVVPSTFWKKKNIGQNWYLGETLHSGIGQGYFLSTPIQLCLMTAQIANGGYKIKPKIIIRTSIGSQRPLHPQYQHIGDFSVAIQKMCSTIDVIKLNDPNKIFSSYKKAYERKDGKNTILVEYGDYYGEK